MALVSREWISPWRLRESDGAGRGWRTSSTYKRMAVRCDVRERLVADVIRTVELLIDVLLNQQRALKLSGSSAGVMDKNFTELVGEKERALGALCEHEKEHGCREAAIT